MISTQLRPGRILVHYLYSIRAKNFLTIVFCTKTQLPLFDTLSRDWKLNQQHFIESVQLSLSRTKSMNRCNSQLLDFIVEIDKSICHPARQVIEKSLNKKIMFRTNLICQI
jgi:hypothetical protein